MRLSLAILTCDVVLLRSCLAHALDAATGPLDVLVVGNGVQLPESLPELATPKVERVHLDSLPENLGVMRGLTRLWQTAAGMGVPAAEHVVAFIHDDLELHESGWDRRVLAAFERDPRLGLVGFGGSTGLGAADIYQTPYELHQLGRLGFASSMTDAESHGERRTEECQAVFFDGFSMIVRRSLLDEIEAWNSMPFFASYGEDAFIACQARRHGYTGRLVPCACTHLNGRTRFTENYRRDVAAHGGDRDQHDRAHEYIYREFRDVLPLRL